LSGRPYSEKLLKAGAYLFHQLKNGLSDVALEENLKLSGLFGAAVILTVL
jgi:hypothetical protein